ncbi:hypothetical protein vseg_005971 [Gypsophila vaccaria]
MVKINGGDCNEMMIGLRMVDWWRVIEFNLRMYMTKTSSFTTVWEMPKSI